MAAFVAPKYKNSIFAVVDPTLTANSSRQQTLKHLGYEDSVVNHLLLIMDIE
jgi:hypothetical protein